MNESFNKLYKGVGNFLYNTIVQTPFSILCGLACIHCLPSHSNITHQMEKRDLIKRVSNDCGPPFSVDNIGEQNSSPELMSAFNQHYYEKIGKLGIKSLKINSPAEFALFGGTQLFVIAASGIGALGMYVEAAQEYGPKALIPLALTTGLSLAHEIRFNRKLKNIEGTLDYPNPVC